jgi:class 3 adenylate cyclase
MGLHTTEPHVHADGYVGVGVSRAARICAAAHGGQIVLSQATAGIVEDDENRPQRLFQIDADGLPCDFPPLSARGASGTIATLLALDLAYWLPVMLDLGDEGAAIAAAAYHRIVDASARANDGFEVERAGDHALCVFLSAKSALLAVAAIRVELRDRDWIEGTEKPELAAAIHTGRVTSLTGGQLGSPAARVIRLCDTAEPGQVLVSHATHALLEGEVLGELQLRDLGDRELLGTTPIRVYELVDPSASA